MQSFHLKSVPFNMSLCGISKKDPKKKKWFVCVVLAERAAVQIT